MRRGKSFIVVQTPPVMMTSDSRKRKGIGGQAVIGGVMMKGPKHMAIAVRRPDGQIETRTERVKSKEERHPVASWPLVRGVIVLGETLVLGYKALTYSADVSMGEDDSLDWKEVALSFVLAIGFALLLFKLLPLFIADLLSKHLPAVSKSYLLYNLIDGTMKIGLFLLYILLIGLLADVKEVFAYHGAEHKTVNCFEQEGHLDYDACSRHSVINPRCGTTFVILVLLLSIFIYLLIPSASPFWLKYLLRLALLPVIAGVSYELIKLASRLWDYRGMRYAMSPLLVVQKLTTREPTPEQLEVGIAAMEAVLQLEEQ